MGWRARQSLCRSPGRLPAAQTITASGSPSSLTAPISSPWLGSGAEGAALREAIAELRRAGETVVCALPGHESEVDEFQCDRELARDATGRWSVRAL